MGLIPVARFGCQVNAATPINDAERELKDLQDGIKRLVPEMVEANQARARAH